MMKLFQLFKGKFLILIVSVLAALLVIIFSFWVVSEQNSTQTNVLNALQQRQAILLGQSLFVSADFEDVESLQLLTAGAVTKLEELSGVTVYVPRPQGFEIIASSEANQIGLVVSDVQKIKAYESKDIVTFQKQVISGGQDRELLDTEIIPLIPVLIDGEVGYLVELLMSTQQVIEVNDIFLRNNTFFFGLFGAGIAVLVVALGWSLYRTRLVQEKAVADISRKDELLATAAHDLRGPLIVIRQDIKEIIEKGLELSADRFSKLSGEIRSSTMSTIEFLEDLLIISRFERGKEQIFPRPSFLQDTLTPLIEQFTPQAESKGLQLELTSDISKLPKVIIDPGKISESISNYISNAIKYSDKGIVKVHIEIKGGTQGQFIVLGVRDQGVGISDKDQKKLFQSFSRVGETRATHPGNGLGLYIVKHIIEAHGGQVGIESVKGQGSTFYITIPIPSAADLVGADKQS